MFGNVSQLVSGCVSTNQFI